MNYPEEVVFLHESPRSERVELTLDNLRQINQSLEDEQFFIAEEAIASCGRFWSEFPTDSLNEEGSMLLADITQRENELSLTWFWEYSHTADNHHRPNEYFPPLQPFSFKYSKAKFTRLNEPVREQVHKIEDVFALLRERHHELAAIRKLIARYIKKVKRDYRKVAFQKVPDRIKLS